MKKAYEAVKKTLYNCFSTYVSLQKFINFDRMKISYKSYYTIEHYFAHTSIKSLMVNYQNQDRFIGYCKACNLYDKCWTCPPFSYDVNNFISQFTQAIIIGSKIIFKEKELKTLSINEFCNAVTVEVRQEEDLLLLEYEKKHPGSRVFFGGSCHFCSSNSCSRIKGEACIFPEKMRPSLEAFGFDLRKTAEELLGIKLQWGKKGFLPPYLTLISAILK